MVGRDGAGDSVPSRIGRAADISSCAIKAGKGANLSELLNNLERIPPLVYRGSDMDTYIADGCKLLLCAWTYLMNSSSDCMPSC